MVRTALADVIRSAFKARGRRAKSLKRRSSKSRSASSIRHALIEQLEDRRVLATFAVMNIADSGAGSLRQAIVDANTNVGADIIQFDSSVAGTITLTSGELTITDDVDLQGPGPEILTLSGNHLSRVLQVNADTTISGLTIHDGISNYGGGIYNLATLTLESTIIVGNSATSDGGGIYNAGVLAVVSSTLSANSAGPSPGANGAGGGILNTGILTLESSSINGNSATYQGGGIFNFGGTMNVHSSHFSDNYGTYYGGAIRNNATLEIDSSYFSGNWAVYGGAVNNLPDATSTVHASTFDSNSGGALYNRGAMAVDGSTLSRNSANSGGGIENDGSGSLTLTNSTLSENTAANGGGIGNRDSGTVLITNSTISRNVASNFAGGGIYNRSSITLNNTIVAANFVADINDDIDGAIDSNSSHNLIGVDKNLVGISNGSNGNQVGTTGIPINPMLGSLKSNGGSTLTMALLPGSSAINAGDNSLVPLNVTTDQRGAGYARIESGTVDIGALESVTVNDPPSTFVVTNLDDNGPGSLRQAILDANANLGPDIIQFASGLTGTVTLTSGELDISDDAVDIQGPGASIVTVSGNDASRVFYVDANATIRGLTISHGNADNGGGIYNAFGTLTVLNSTLSNNTAQNGGGIYNAYGALTVDNSVLDTNTSSGVWYYGPGYSGGGAIYNANYGTQTVIKDSSLTGNSSVFAGGGINNVGDLTLENSSVGGNFAFDEGGGLFNWGTLAIETSAISNNSAGPSPGANGAGGGILNFATLTVHNSSINGNSATYQGGGIFNRGGIMHVHSSTLSDNYGTYYGGAILNQATLDIDDSYFSGNWAVYGGAVNNWPDATSTVHASTFDSNSGGALYNRGTMAVDGSTLSRNSADSGGGIENDGSGSLTLTNSTLSENTAANGGGIGNRDSGTVLIINSTISRNTASNYAGGGIYNRSSLTLNNTIVAANFVADINDDIDGAIDSNSSHNLIGMDKNLVGISDGSNGNQIGTVVTPNDPLLGALQNNGGPTFTMALQLGSSAINAGANGLVPTGVTTDQRGTGYARIDSGSVDIGAFELVLNHPPIANAGGPYVVNQGANVQLDASASFDLDQSTETLVFQWDLDGDGVFGETGTSATLGDEIGISPTFSAATLVGASSHTVHLKVLDNALASSESTSTVIVHGAPVITAIGPQDCSETELIIPVTAYDPEGGLLTYTVSFVSETGAGAVNAPTNFSIDSGGLFHWTPGGGQLGEYTFQVNVLDSDGLTAQQTFVATTLGVVDGVLVIVGTDGIDKIDIKSTDGQEGHGDGGEGRHDVAEDSDDGQGDTAVTVKINEKDYHYKLKPQYNSANPYAGITLIHICGLGGDDQINIHNDIAISAWLEGGAGNDQLHGGEGDDVIFGGSGNDEIFGDDGNDFLVGGLGADKLKGDKGHDILVSGDIAGSLDFATLRAISQAWADSHSAAEAETIDTALDETLDDAVGDQLTGGAGADLFIVNTGDTITDFKFGKSKDKKEGDVVVKDGVITI